MASISASTLMVSTGGPLSRSASERSPLSPPTPFTCKLREMVSGFYCKAMIRCTAEVVGSISTMPPLRSLGELGKVVMDSLTLCFKWVEE